MSYINDALKKAQQERDGRYERFGGIISSGPLGSGQPRKMSLARVVAVLLLILIPAGLLVAVYVLQQPPLLTTGEPAPPIAGKNAPLESVNRQRAAEAGSADQAISRPQPDKTEVPGGAAPEERQTDGKPALHEAEVRFREALAAQRRGDSPGAEALYQKVLAIDPRHVRALNNLGIIRMGQKKREQAIGLFSKAIVLKRDYADPYYNIACLYAQTNEIDESLWYLQVAMTVNSDVKNWAEKDGDMKNVVASPQYKKITEGQKN